MRNRRGYCTVELTRWVTEDYQHDISKPKRNIWQLTSVSLSLEWRQDDELTIESSPSVQVFPIQSNRKPENSPQPHPYHVRVTPERVSRDVTREMVASSGRCRVVWPDFE
jgi:hypothetical protein